ncbi:helix-turn-helix domain-containing protein [Larkinella insperata]|uniref:Helix-turn-helix domain-containing protein n=1 Tax=Larkinella insperata TaxID=332158 RepID=A0ABW3Q958_9BACT|nr:LexA family transcriptional regulator [Larkinella insperata]
MKFMHLAGNLVFLRQHWGLSQSEVASTIGISRPSLIAYEKGAAKPTIETAGGLASLYKVTIDTLLYRDLTQLSPPQIELLFEGPDIAQRGQTLRIRELIHTIGDDKEENIEMVPVKAAMGYCQGGFNDEVFIAELPWFRLPFVSKDRKYRLFPTIGDSMLPIPEGSYVLGEYIEKWNTIKDGTGVVVVSKEGIVVKKAINELARNGRLILHSLNPMYQPYEMPVDDILELWRFELYMSRAFPDPEPPLSAILSEMRRLQDGLADLQSGQEKILERVQ